MSIRPRRLLIVCSGNICRSPMAHGMAEAHAKTSELPLEVQSAGTLMIEDAPADSRAIRVCKEIGLDITAHRSQGLTPELVGWADRILVMEMAHAMAVRQLCPDIEEDKLHLLGGFIGTTNIEDPIRSWFIGPFRTARSEISEALSQFFSYWESTGS
jgi:protein-tyrosine phosphatase